MRKMDDRDVKTLLETYWSPRGWNPEELRATSPDDLAYAKSQRVMFDSARLDHGQAVRHYLDNCTGRTVVSKLHNASG